MRGSGILPWQTAKGNPLTSLRVYPHCNGADSGYKKASFMNPRTRRPRGGLSERIIKSVPLSALAPLFRRQADVLGWIAAGKRNDEIATILAISRRTVEKHVEKIFAALDVETRAAAAAWWHEQR